MLIRIPTGQAFPEGPARGPGGFPLRFNGPLKR